MVTTGYSRSIGRLSNCLSFVTVQVPQEQGSAPLRYDARIVGSSLVIALRTALTSPHLKRYSLS
jgi:hypothetical protein